MLAADKLLLQSRIRQNAIQLKEKEFSLHNDNFGTVGTQAAVIAGFTMTALVEIGIPTGTPRWLLFFYFNANVISLVCNVYCVSQTTTLSVCGTSLSLRGPDGSMITAVDGMFAERRQVFRTFAIGLFSLLIGMVFGSWIILVQPLSATGRPIWQLAAGNAPEAAVSCNFVLLYGMRIIYDQCNRLFERFAYNENESTSFDDLLDLPMQLPKSAREASEAALEGVRHGIHQGMGYLSRRRGDRTSDSPTDIDLEAMLGGS